MTLDPMAHFVQLKVRISSVTAILVSTHAHMSAILVGQGPCAAADLPDRTTSYLVHTSKLIEDPYSSHLAS